MAELPENNFLLEWAREIGKDHPFLDFHVHPFDVLSADIEYQANGSLDGVFSRGSACYHAPELDFRGGVTLLQPVENTERALLLAARFAYAHTGAKVVSDQLDLVGISGALLLPVARVPGSAEKLLPAINRMFGGDDRFLPGCPFPVGVGCDDLRPFFRQARARWGVRAVKLHCNLAGLDLASRSGRDLMEATLEAAGALNLTIVLHGGRTPGLEPLERREYGRLSNLAQVNWGISSAPVVIAHAGCYALADDEIPATLRILDSLFDRYPNLMADTSNLGFSVLQKLLTSVDCGRLVFGSDALYIPIWRAWLRFLEALQLFSPCPDRDLLRIASVNPWQCLSQTAQVVSL